MNARLHHIALICSDITRSRDFYSRVLGMRLVRQEYRATRQSWKVDMRGLGIQLELFTFPDAPQRPSRPEALGLRHLALEVSNIDEAIARVRACDVTIEPVRIDAATNARYTFFADPDGLPIELYESPG